MGFPACRLTHRLGLPFPERKTDDPRLGGRVEVRDESAPFCLPLIRSRDDLGTREDVPGVEVGTGYMEGEHLVRGGSIALYEYLRMHIPDCLQILLPCFNFLEVDQEGLAQ